MMSCPFVHFSLPHHVHNTFLSTSSLEMELTGIGSILEAMEGIDNSLFCLYGHINSIYLRRREGNAGSSFFKFCWVQFSVGQSGNERIFDN